MQTSIHACICLSVVLFDTFPIVPKTGEDIKTSNYFVYDNDQFQGDPQVFTTSGDGSVPLHSLEVPHYTMHFVQNTMFCL